MEAAPGQLGSMEAKVRLGGEPHLPNGMHPSIRVAENGLGSADAPGRKAARLSHEGVSLGGLPSTGKLAAHSAGPAGSTAVQKPPPGSALAEVLSLDEMPVGDARFGAHAQLRSAMATASAIASRLTAAGAGEEPLPPIPDGIQEQMTSSPEQVRQLVQSLRDGQTRARARAGQLNVAMARLDRWTQCLADSKKGKALEGGAGGITASKKAEGIRGHSPGANGLSSEDGLGSDTVRVKGSANRKPRTSAGTPRANPLTPEFSGPGAHQGTPSLPSTPVPDDWATPSPMAADAAGGEQKRGPMKGKRSRPKGGEAGTPREEGGLPAANQSKQMRKGKPAAGFPDGTEELVHTGAMADDERLLRRDGSLTAKGKGSRGARSQGKVAADPWEGSEHFLGAGMTPEGLDHDSDLDGLGRPVRPSGPHPRSRKVSRLTKVLGDEDEAGDAVLGGTADEQHDHGPLSRTASGRAVPRARAGRAARGEGAVDMDFLEDEEELDDEDDDDEEEVPEEEDEEDEEMEDGALLGTVERRGVGGGLLLDGDYGNHAPLRSSKAKAGAKAKDKLLKRHASSKLKKHGSSSARGGTGFWVQGAEGQLLNGTAGTPGGASDPSTAKAAKHHSGGGTKASKVQKKAGKKAGAAQAPVVQEFVCSDEEELSHAVSATVEFLAHSSSAPLWKFVEPFFGIPHLADVDSLLDLSESSAREAAELAIPELSSSMQPKEAAKKANKKGSAKAPQRSPWSSALGSSSSRGPPHSVSLRLLGLLAQPRQGGEQRANSTAAASLTERLGNGGATEPASGTRGHPPPKGAAKGKGSKAGLPQLLPAAQDPTVEVREAGYLGEDWRRAYSALNTDARVLVELQHLGLGDCVQSVLRGEAPEDDEICASFRGTMEDLAGHASATKAHMHRVRAGFAGKQQHEEDSRRREQLMVHRLLEAAYARRTGAKLYTVATPLIPRSTAAVKAARQTSVPFARRALDRAQAFESTGTCLSAYPALKTKLLQDLPPPPSLLPEPAAPPPPPREPAPKAIPVPASPALWDSAYMVGTPEVQLLDTGPDAFEMRDLFGGGQGSGALLLREAVPAKPSMRRQDSSSGVPRARGPSPLDWDDPKGAHQIVRMRSLDEVQGTLARGPKGTGDMPVMMPTASVKRKRSERDALAGAAAQDRPKGGVGELERPKGGVGPLGADGKPRAKAKNQRKQRTAGLLRIAGTPPTPFFSEASTPETKALSPPPASPSAFLLSSIDDTPLPAPAAARMSPPASPGPAPHASGAPVAPVTSKRSRGPSKVKHHRAQQQPDAQHQAVAASPLPWTPRDSILTPDVATPGDLLPDMAAAEDMKDDEDAGPAPAAMDGRGAGEDGPAAPVASAGPPLGTLDAPLGAPPLPEPPMDEMEMGWLSNLGDMGALGGEGIEGLSGLAVPMDDLADLGF